VILLPAVPEGRDASKRKPKTNGALSVQRRKIMKKNYTRILIALIVIAGSAVAAKAQVFDQVAAKITHEFVVDGKTFPAGSYKVERASSSDDRELLIRNVDTSESALIAPTVVESNLSDHATISFEHVGDELLLNKIETADHIFTIPVSRSEIMEAEAKPH
jgi:predicted secreted protein